MMWNQGYQLKHKPYQILRQLGGGGFGLTFLAQDLYLNRKVVIKAPNRELQRDQDYDKFIRRFRREGESLKKISHPNIVKVIELFQEEQIPCLVLAYIEGETLNECIRQHGAIAEAQAVEIFRKLAMALQTLHQAGLIHCDVHPGNMMLRQDDREPILIDFGSAKLLQPHTYTVTTTVNDGYTPYEQRRKDADPNAKWDIYGLTATLYFAVTGQKPQTSVDRKLYGDALIAPQKHRSDLSSWLSQAILQGMDLEPDNRPASMQIWLGALYPPQAGIPRPRFPFIALAFLMLGNIPTGILLGLTSVTVEAWALAGALAWTGALSWALALAWTLAGAWAWAWALAGAFGLALVGAFAVAVAWAVAWAWAWTWSKSDTNVAIQFWIWTAGGGIIGTIVGAQTSIGIWAGLGFGLLASVQFWTIVVSMISSHNVLEKNYNLLHIFFIWGITSTIGLALGGGVGWWLKLGGVGLPS